MNSNRITLTQALEFFKAFAGDKIVFENSYCGTYTDHYSAILRVEISSLRVKVNSDYPNPKCVDKNNLTNVSIDSIRKISNENTQFEPFEIDGKILNLQAFIPKHKTLFNPSEQQKLEKLLERFQFFYSQILLEQTTKFDRSRFDSLFINL